MKYSEKLLDPRWQKKRLEIFERDEWMCGLCQDNEQTLHIHHLFYEKGKDPWEYENKHLITLCANCHEAETETRNIIERGLNLELSKKGFMSSDLIRLTEGFRDLTIITAPEVTASIICFALQTPEIMNLLDDLFFKDLGEKVKNKEPNDGKE